MERVNINLPKILFFKFKFFKAKKSDRKKNTQSNLHRFFSKYLYFLLKKFLKPIYDLFIKILRKFLL